jgi:hypothetical protein
VRHWEACAQVCVWEERVCFCIHWRTVF